MRRFAARFLTLTLWGTTAAASLGQNLLPNGGFDSGLAPWTPWLPPATWTPLDAAGSPSSGSIRGAYNLPGPVAGAVALSPCIAVSPGEYQTAIDILLPAGQGLTGDAHFNLYFHSDQRCRTVLDATYGARVFTDATTGEWTHLTKTLTIPPGTVSLLATLGMGKLEAAGSLEAYFDNATVCRAGSCDDPAGDWITDAHYPNFRFRVVITPAGGAPLAGVKEADCQPEVVCVSGSLPGRSEVFLRIVGPRPNGFLWPTVVRFTASRVEVEIEQLSTGELRVYTLEAPAPADLTELSGLQDREGFRP